MKKTIFFIILLSHFIIFSQEVELKGEVFDEYLEPFANALIKTPNGKTTTSDHDGQFTIKTKLPVTLTVYYIGYSTEKVIVNSEDDQIGIILKENSGLEQIVLSATRTPERLFESPVTVRRISLNDIKKTPSTSFYEAIGNLRNVDIKTNSILLKSVNTKGFSTLKNNRFVQLIDGVDNVFPTASFSPGNMIGLVDMDVENIEILEGASSALYGASAFNGVLFIKSKSPFDYEGISAEFKGGITKQASGRADGFYHPAIRFAYKFSDYFAAKASFSHYTGKEWEHNDLRGLDDKEYIVEDASRNQDYYNGVNTYGDEIEINQKTGPFMNFLKTSADLLKAKTTVETLTKIQQQRVLTSEEQMMLAQSSKSLPLLQAGLGIAGGALALSGNEDITREGYHQKYLVDDKAKNIKFNTSLHWRPFANNKFEVIWTSRFNVANSLFNYGNNKIAVRDASFNQHVLEFKGENFFLRGFETTSDSGDTYSVNALGLLINETAKPTDVWATEYIGSYINARSEAMKNGINMSPDQANKIARGIADSVTPVLDDDGNPTGKYYMARIQPNSAIFNQLVNHFKNKYVTDGGAKFNEKSKIYNVEGNFNFGKYIDFAEIQIGGSFRRYDIQALGYMTTQIGERIQDDSYGAYSQVRKKLLDDRMDITASVRYDRVAEMKKGAYSPRFAIGYTTGKDRNHHFRFSVQEAYRQPNLNERYNVLPLGNNSYVLGNSKNNLKRFKAQIGSGRKEIFREKLIDENVLRNEKGFIVSSLDKFYSDLVYKMNPTDGFDAILKKASEGFKTIESDQIQEELRPEHVMSFELGYRGMVNVSPTNILEIDFSGYYNKYEDFIRYQDLYFPGLSRNENVVPDAGASNNVIGKNGQLGAGDVFTNPFTMAILMVVANNRAMISIPKNSEANINAYGAGVSVKTRLFDNYKVSLNYAWNDFNYDKNGDTDFVPEFNTSKHNVKMMIGNDNLFRNLGFNVAARWQSGYFWHSHFANGKIDPMTVVDAQISYTIPKMKSKIKLGANNLFGKSYYDNIGNGAIGNIYYLSWVIH